VPFSSSFNPSTDPFTYHTHIHLSISHPCTYPYTPSFPLRTSDPSQLAACIYFYRANLVCFHGISNWYWPSISPNLLIVSLRKYESPQIFVRHTVVNWIPYADANLAWGWQFETAGLSIKWVSRVCLIMSIYTWFRDVCDAWAFLKAALCYQCSELARVTWMLGPNNPMCLKHSKLPLNSNLPRFVLEKQKLDIKNHSLEIYAPFKLDQKHRNKGQTTGEIVRRSNGKYSVYTNSPGPPW